MNGEPSFLNEFILIMFYVYYITSLSHPNKTYIGFTQNLMQRLDEHNCGKSIYTNQFKPWKIIGFFGFTQEIDARHFEKYLKSNAGKIFLKRHFSPTNIHNSDNSRYTSSYKF